MKRFLTITALVVAVALLPCRSDAGDAGPLFTTPLVGLSIGAMAGFLAALLSAHPADHYDSYAYIGGSIGLACGFALGISEAGNTTALLYRHDTPKDKLYGLSIAISLK